MADVAILGLGLMGSTLAAHLHADGQTVAGYDPDSDRREDVARLGGEVFDSVAGAVSAAPIVVLSLPNSAITLEVCNEIVAASAVEGLLVIDTTTGDPNDSMLAATNLAAAGHRYTDATISGNAAQFGERDVIFMIGGAPADVAQATEFLAPFGRAVYGVGDVGAGSRAKLVVNHVLSINRAALAEGLAVAEKAGIELEQMLEVLLDSAAHSKAMHIWGKRMVEGDHEAPASRIRQGHKDSRLINEHAASLGASHSVVDAVRALYEAAEEEGLSDADQSALMELMRHRAGIGRQ